MKNHNRFLKITLLLAPLHVAACVPVHNAAQSHATVWGPTPQVVIDPSGNGRDKLRIPGGSGCDDPGDMIEHPECRT